MALETMNCGSTVLANMNPSVFVLGSRAAAVPLRQQVERALDQSSFTVCVDFGGVEVTQGFIDKLIGALILRRGPPVLDQLAFGRCSENVRAVIQLVASCRVQDFNQSGLRQKCANGGAA